MLFPENFTVDGFGSRDVYGFVQCVRWRTSSGMRREVVFILPRRQTLASPYGTWIVNEFIDFIISNKIFKLHKFWIENVKQNAIIRLYFPCLIYDQTIINIWNSNEMRISHKVKSPFEIPPKNYFILCSGWRGYARRRWHRCSPQIWLNIRSYTSFPLPFYLLHCSRLSFNSFKCLQSSWSQDATSKATPKHSLFSRKGRGRQSFAFYRTAPIRRATTCRLPSPAPRRTSNWKRRKGNILCENFCSLPHQLF